MGSVVWKVMARLLIFAALLALGAAVPQRIRTRGRSRQQVAPQPSGRQLQQAGPPPGPTVSYPEITSCPEQYGEQAYHHPINCDQFYKCTNGTLTLETCENGLLFDGTGAVHNFCNYNWRANCEGRVHEQLPIARGPCEYAFGIFTAGPCEQYYTKCEYGEPIDEPCTPGLAYDERLHACNWPDLLEYCVPEEVVGFRCPAQLDPRDPASRFLNPRFAVPGDCSRYYFCVNGQPRLGHCGDYAVFDESILACADAETVPACFKK